MARLGVIDIGSNSVHLLVAELQGKKLRPIRDEKLRLPLGATVAERGAFGDDLTAIVAGAAGRFAGLARRAGAEQTVVVATQAVRVAQDAARLCAAVQAAAGLMVHVLTPAQEAALCLAGASAHTLGETPFALADIGGGSTDMALVGPDGIEAVESVALGSGVLASRWCAGDPPLAGALAEAETEVRRLLSGSEFGARGGVPRLVLTGGAGKRLLRYHDADDLAGEQLPAVVVHGLIDGVLSRPAVAWKRSQRDAGRAHVTRAGAVILRVVLCEARVRVCTISLQGLREGVLRSIYRREPHAAVFAATAPVTGLAQG